MSDYSLFSKGGCLNLVFKLTEILYNKFYIYPRIGVEIEFYLQSMQVVDNIKKYQIANFTNRLFQLGYQIIPEDRYNQFELILKPSSKTLDLCEHINFCKSLLQETALELNMDVIFPPTNSCPKTDAGTHYHLSLHDCKGNNLFAVEKVVNGSFISKIAGSMLDILQGSMYYLCGNNDIEYRRFLPSKTSPSSVSWGKNNRTVAVRVPTSAKENRRLEFRVPSAAVNHEKVIFWLLFTVLRAMHEKTREFAIIYGDAFDKQYKQEALPTCLSEAKENDNFEKIFMEIIKYYS